MKFTFPSPMGRTWSLAEALEPGELLRATGSQPRPNFGGKPAALEEMACFWRGAVAVLRKTHFRSLFRLHLSPAVEF